MDRTTSEQLLEDQTPFGKFKTQFVFVQRLLDDWTPYATHRWGLTACTAMLYFLRVFIAGGWYVVTYALGIYMLQMFLAFLTPKFDPALEEMADQEEQSLPLKSDDEFKPFIRRLPEFKFWYATQRAFTIALFCSMSRFFDIPVFWPVLLIYWILLVFLTMRRQIQHMIQYKYIPFNIGKKRYTSVNSFMPQK